MATIIIASIISSFAILAYFQSQRTLLGNSINIAGKNRFLTMNLLFQTSAYLNEVSSSSSSRNSRDKINNAINNLDANILLLRQGGITGDIELKPLPSNFLGYWKRIDNDWNSYKSFIMNRVVNPEKSLLQQQQQKQQPTLKTIGTSATTNNASTSTAAKTYESTRADLESLATNLINSSDMLVTQLGINSAKSSLNVVMLEILFGIMNIAIVLLIVYLVTKILKPISALTQATYEIKKGNLDVPIHKKYKGNDELSILSESFNSMVQSIKNHITKQNQLNEQLEQNDKLKDEFINIAAHELRTPIQPIIGLSQVLQSKIKGMEYQQLLDVIVRNAKRLQGLTENILDVTRIESNSLQLNKEQFDLHKMILNAMADSESQLKEHGRDIC